MKSKEQKNHSILGTIMKIPGRLNILITTVAIVVCFGLHTHADQKECDLRCLKEQIPLIDSMPNPEWPEHFVYLFCPISSKEPIPVVFFCHGIGASCPSNYGGLISRIIQNGYAVMYSPFKTSLFKPNKCYTMMWNGFKGGVKKWGMKLDTTRIGFVGHSYGGGAVPGLAHKALTKHHWGSQRAFLYIMAPWFSHWITQKDLETFPPNTHLVIQVFENDNINDPRMALDIYETINISPHNKWFIYTHNDSCEDGILIADHEQPMNKCGSGSPSDSLCHFGFSQIIDTLISHGQTKECNDSSKTLGEKLTTSFRQATCFNSTNSLVHLTPSATQFIQPEIRYINFWNHAMNPRANNLLTWHADDSTARVKSRTTISNYFWYLLYPKMLQGQEEDMAEEDIDQWEEHIERRDASVYTQMIQRHRNRYTNEPGPIESGCGARGPFGVVQQFIPNSGNGTGKLYILLPLKGKEPYPLIYFRPTIMTSSRKYRELLFFLASQGNVVITSTNAKLPYFGEKRRYKSALNEFEICCKMLTGLIDTSRIGFITHSFGTSSLLSLANTYLGERKWGSNGAFIFLMAPNYYSRQRNANLNDIPPHTLIGVQIFEEHSTKEWQYAHDMFNAFTVSDAQKHLMLVHSFKKGIFNKVEAERSSPICDERDEDFNCIFHYGICRPLCAIAQRAFNPHITDSCDINVFTEMSQYRVIFKGRKWKPLTDLNKK